MKFWQTFVDEDFLNSVRKFVDTEIRPCADKLDSEDIYPTQIAKSIAKRGWTTLSLPAEYGGSALPFEYPLALFEEISVSSAAVAISLTSTYQAQTVILRFGSETLKKRYLPAIQEGLLCAYALTEDKHGSDIRKLETKAKLEGNEWVINGEKSFITSGSAAEFFIVLAETQSGVSTFAVPSTTRGVSTYVGERSSTFGLRNGPHVNLKLDDVRVPADHLIGVEGKGVRQVATALDFSRTLAAGVSVGIARAAFEDSLLYVKERSAFDKKVIEFQGIQWYFADMLAEIDAARLLAYRAAAALNDHHEIERYSSEAKLKAAKVAMDMTRIAMQVCGAYGTSDVAPYGRYLRDAKTYEIAGGSSEVLKNTIAKYILKSVAGQ